MHSLGLKIICINKVYQSHMKKIANPNFIYIITFMIPVLVYTLGWSTIYPVLTTQLFTFYLVSFLIAFVMGVLINQLPGFKYKPIPVFKYNGYVIIGLLILHAINVLYAGYVPLIAIVSGNQTYADNRFSGIPTFHVILTTFTLFFAIYIFHQYLSNRKWSLLLLYISSILPFVFYLNRSGMMYIIIGSLFMYFISQKKLYVKKLIGLITFALICIYLFGYLGNLRSTSGDKTWILRATGATDKFLENRVPNEFYWGYLYITSSVASLQNNINVEKNVVPEYKGFVVNEMIPDFISKKISSITSIPVREFNQMTSWLNVGTIYANSFSYLSWLGMGIIFIYLMLLMNLYYVIIKRSYLYGATGIAMMFTMIAFANFSNSLSFSFFSFPLFYPFLFSILKGYKRRFQNKKAMESFLPV